MSLAKCNLYDAIRMLEAEKRGGNRRRVDLVQDGDSHVALINLLSSDGTTPSQDLANDEVRGLLEDAIRELPSDYRAVVWRYDINGETVATIAESLNRSPGAIYMLRARAHDWLRVRLGSTSKFFSDSA